MCCSWRETVKVLSTVALVVLGLALGVVTALHEFQAGLTADIDQTGGALNPGMIGAIVTGLVSFFYGLFLLYRHYENWRNSRHA